MAPVLEGGMTGMLSSRSSLSNAQSICQFASSAPEHPDGAQSVYIEDLTWPEVKAAIAAGKTTAIIYAGSTEQDGPHMALGKHNFIAHYAAGEIAKKLGNALAYPTMPFAPTGSRELRTGH